MIKVSPFKCTFLGIFIIFASCSKMKSREEISSLETLPKAQLKKAPTLKKSVVAVKKPVKLNELCIAALKNLPGRYYEKMLSQVCQTVAQHNSCRSEKDVPIFHYDRSSGKKDSLNVLVFALIHGDEPQGGSVARAWMSRLTELNPRNNWRI
ncbi:hypothetical protein OAB57_03430, partial [Bacteriovoracaceae bacterium]|nr:hypothetical protein [Bacteriovoracaceae bacterium]